MLKNIFTLQYCQGCIVKKDKEKKVLLVIRVEESVKEDLKVYCIKKKTTISGIISHFIKSLKI